MGHLKKERAKNRWAIVGLAVLAVITLACCVYAFTLPSAKGLGTNRPPTGQYDQLAPGSKR